MEDEDLILDPSIDYHLIEGLSSEVKERLTKVRPASIVSLRHSFPAEQPCKLDLFRSAGRCKTNGGHDTDIFSIVTSIRKKGSETSLSGGGLGLVIT